MLKIIMGVAILVILTAVGLFYISSLSMNEGVDNYTPETQQETQEQPVTEGAFAPAQNDMVGTGPLQGLASMQDPVSCTVTANTAELGELQGQVFASNGSIRGNFIYLVNGEQMQLNVINDGVSGHTWGDSPAGTFAMKYDIDQPSSTAFDYSQSVTYSCAPWEIDGTVFTPPADIVFNDMAPAPEVSI